MFFHLSKLPERSEHKTTILMMMTIMQLMEGFTKHYKGTAQAADVVALCSAVVSQGARNQMAHFMSRARCSMFNQG